MRLELYRIRYAYGKLATLASDEALEFVLNNARKDVPQNESTWPNFTFVQTCRFCGQRLIWLTDATGREEKENDITRKNNAGEKNCGF